MKALVTGGTGFIGSNLVRRLSELGWEVVATGRSGENELGAIPCFDFVGDFDSVRRCGPYDVVFHQAANNDTLDFDSEVMMEANLNHPRRAFYDLARDGCKRFIYASSTAVYGNSPAPYREGETAENPLNPYGLSKLEFERFASEFANEGVQILGLRYCNVYGPGENHKFRRASMIKQMIDTLISGGICKLFPSGEQERDWIHVTDVVKANLAAYEYGGNGIFNCGSGRSTSFLRIHQIICDELGIDSPIEWKDNPYADKYQSLTRCDMTKSKEILRFEPQTFIEEGVRNYVNYSTKKAER